MIEPTTLASLLVICIVTVSTQAPRNSTEQHYEGEAVATKGILDILFGRPKSCSCECGRPNRASRLRGGEFTHNHEFPWLAAILVTNSTSGTKIISAGTLINDRFLLTSAHPVYGAAPHEVKVTLGAFDRCVSEVTTANVSVANIIINSNFDWLTGTGDIALLQLNAPITLTKNISPICLPKQGSKYLGQVATIVVWGEPPLSGNTNKSPPVNTTNTNPTTSANNTSAGRRQLEPRQGSPSTCRPRKVGLPVLNDDDCTVSDDLVNTFDKGCAGIIGGRALTCAADAGGPVQFRSKQGIYQIIGVLSAKNHCEGDPGGDQMDLSLYTMVTEYLGWIERATADACYC